MTKNTINPTAKPRDQRRWPLPVGVFISAMLLGAVVAVGGKGVLSDTLAASSASLANLILLKLTKNTGVRAWSVYWLQVTYTIQGFLSLIAFLTFPDVLKSDRVLSAAMFSDSLALFQALTVVPSACYLANLLSSVLGMGRAPPMNEILRNDQKVILPLLWISLGLHSLNWASATGTGTISYVIRILWGAVFLVPYLAGVCVKEHPKTALAWLTGILGSLLLAAITGSRGVAFIPALAFSVGLLHSKISPKVKVRRLYPGFAVLGLLGLMLAGAIEETRSKHGRGGLELLKTIEFRALAITLVESLSAKTQSPGTETTLSQGYLRLIAWTNLVVPIQTPNIIPYRGYGDIKDEIQSALQAGQDRSMVYFENIHAKDYGFYVSETSSVEWGIVADGWSRGGFVSAFFYAIMGSAALLIAEGTGIGTSKRLRGLYIVLLFVLLNIAIFGMQRSGLVSQVRAIALNTLMTLVVLWPVVKFIGFLMPVVSSPSRILKGRA